MAISGFTPYQPTDTSGFRLLASAISDIKRRSQQEDFYKQMQAMESEYSTTPEEYDPRINALSMKIAENVDDPSERKKAEKELMQLKQKKEMASVPEDQKLLKYWTMAETAKNKYGRDIDKYNPFDMQLKAMFGGSDQGTTSYGITLDPLGNAVPKVSARSEQAGVKAWTTLNADIALTSVGKKGSINFMKEFYTMTPEQQNIAKDAVKNALLVQQKKVVDIDSVWEKIKMGRPFSKSSKIVDMTNKEWLQEIGKRSLAIPEYDVASKISGLKKEGVSRSESKKLLEQQIILKNRGGSAPVGPNTAEYLLNRYYGGESGKSSSGRPLTQKALNSYTRIAIKKYPNDKEKIKEEVKRLAKEAGYSID